jgi:hypothetical protein
MLVCVESFHTVWNSLIGLDLRDRTYTGLKKYLMIGGCGQISIAATGVQWVDLHRIGNQKKDQDCGLDWYLRDLDFISHGGRMSSPNMVLWHFV